MATKKKSAPTEERKLSRTGLYMIPVRAIVENHNPRNPLGQKLRERYNLFTGQPNDLWAMLASDDPHRRKEAVEAVEASDPEFASWATTFITVGQLEPVEVRDNGRGTYTLIFGARRCLAVLYNWAKTGQPKEPVIEARLAPKLNETGLLHRSIVENTRKDPNPMERARAIQMALNQGQTVEEVAQVYGASESHVRYTLRLLELPVEVQKRIEGGKLKPAAALKEGKSNGTVATQRVRTRPVKEIQAELEKASKEAEKITEADLEYEARGYLRGLRWAMRLDS